MSREYRNQTDKKNNEKINEMLLDMPLFVEDFYGHMVAQSRSTNTILSYMYEINVFLRFMVTTLKKESVNDLVVEDLDSIKLKNIEAYMARSEDGIELSDNAKRRKLSVLKTFYKYYISTEMIQTNPTLLATGPKLKAHDVIKLSDTQVAALLKCIRTQEGLNYSEHTKKYNQRISDRDLAIVMVLLGTGIRVSELVGLNLTDIDKTEADKYYLRIIRKGGDEDKVRMIDAVSNAVEDYIEFCRPGLVTDSRENALFISTQGRRISVNAVQKMMKKYCRAANLPDNISPHKMRATFATKVYAETKDIYAIKDALHHSSIDTSKHYISDKEKRIDAAAEAASSFFE
ncbi:MAG: tyrosine-type recombinase/integrase [Lachnospiraceae bacterium]|nr:tyrosine-type recombinase/integrase [Lachnospiraceae bacterium]